ncbi:hypothetical protein EH223_17525 [candidate division KSB1 bacterium]|nr:hypothetical protein [candidate division KSB1 bacterium]RQW00777.1 MAG: hypothetical protein EH223_17525 [candidate division KSB1 bacterium]
MKSHRAPIQKIYDSLPVNVKKTVDRAFEILLATKQKGGKILVVTGSGPNIHEGVTTLIAEMIRKGIIDGVTTSSAVVAHEMAGTLEKVRRVNGLSLGFAREMLPRGFTFEITLLDDSTLAQLQKEMPIDLDLFAKAKALPGQDIIKAAGNMAYPLGLRTEELAKEILLIARSRGVPFEKVAGAAADPMTMIGAAQRAGIPCLVTVPQLIGGGMVGIAIADSISIMQRTTEIAHMLAEADVIIESAVALTQEIHDGPFETYTGHGIWAHWTGLPTVSLKDKRLIRIDLDPNLQRAWEFERTSSRVQQAIDQGLPKTKLLDIPFRMEMSGFARLEQSLPIVGDIGAIWPILACKLEAALDIEFDFMSCPQQTPEGAAMREWIVQHVRPVQKANIYLNDSA